MSKLSTSLETYGPYKDVLTSYGVMVLIYI